MGTLKTSAFADKYLPECATKMGCGKTAALDSILVAHQKANSVVQQENNNGVSHKKTEVKKMTEFCPECLKKDIAIKDAEKDHKSELEKLTAAVQTANSHADSLSKELEKSKDLPDFDAIVTHCKTCPTHKAGLEAYNEKLLKSYIENMNKDTATQLARSKGVDLMPDTISLGPNLSRRMRS